MDTGVIYNPTKVQDLVMFRRQIEGECEQRGWESPLWLESDAEDSGAAASRADGLAPTLSSKGPTVLSGTISSPWRR